MNRGYFYEKMFAYKREYIFLNEISENVTISSKINEYFIDFQWNLMF